MTDTPQPATAGETESVDPIAEAAHAFKVNLGQTEPTLPPRDEAGRFAKAETEGEQEIEAEVTDQPETGDAETDAESQEEPEATDEAAEEAQPEAVDLPTSWPAEQAEMWKSLPVEAQEIIRERETQRDAAVNAKFQEAANLRKSHETEISEAQANRQKFAEAADFLLSVVQPQAPSRTLLDPNSSDYNPDAYHLQKAQYEEQVQLLSSVHQQRQQIAQQEAEESEKQRQTRIAELNEKAMPGLVSLVPELGDPAKAQPAFMELARYALSEGVPEETELSAFTAVELKLLAKARKYDEMMAAKAKVTPKAAKPAAPPVRPGVTTPRSAIEATKRKQAEDRLARTGSIEDGAAIFKDLFKKGLS